jgi:hypothetical protein
MPLRKQYAILFCQCQKTPPANCKKIGFYTLFLQLKNISVGVFYNLSCCDLSHFTKNNFLFLTPELKSNILIIGCDIFIALTIIIIKHNKDTELKNGILEGWHDEKYNCGS